MRDSDAADVGEKEEEGLATRIFLGAPAVGPHSVHDPRVDGRDAGSHSVGDVRVASKDAEGTVLEQVEEPHVDDECGCADQTVLDEFYDPGAQCFREASGGGGFGRACRGGRLLDACQGRGWHHLFCFLCGHGKDFNIYFVERLGRPSPSALQMRVHSLTVSI